MAVKRQVCVYPGSGVGGRVVVQVEQVLIEYTSNCLGPWHLYDLPKRLYRRARLLSESYALT